MTDRARFEELIGQQLDTLVQAVESRILGDGEREAALTKEAMQLDDNIHGLLGGSPELVRANDRDELLTRALRLSGRLRQLRETAL